MSCRLSLCVLAASWATAPGQTSSPLSLFLFISCLPLFRSLTQPPALEQVFGPQHCFPKCTWTRLKPHWAMGEIGLWDPWRCRDRSLAPMECSVQLERRAVMFGAAWPMSALGQTWRRVCSPSRLPPILHPPHGSLMKSNVPLQSKGVLSHPF